MSRDVDVIRRVYEAWNEQAMEDWKALHHEDVVVVPPTGWPEGETSVDRDAWLAQTMRLAEPWEEQWIELDELRNVGGWVLAVFRWITRGRGSGIELVTPMACISTIEDGKVTRHEYFLSREAALEAVERGP